MGYYLSEPAPSNCDPTAKNRVWGFFAESVSVSLETRRAALETHRENYDGPRETASGIPLWPSRDPIGERGGVNLYGFVGNDGVNRADYLGTYTINDAWKKLVADGVEPTGPLDTLMEGPGTNRRRYSSQQLFDAWYALEKTRGAWWEVLPKCPKKLCLRNGKPVNPDESKWKDPKKPSNPEALLHPGTKWSMRSKPVSGHSNQCTYADTTDNKFVNLITDAPGAGTVDYKKPGFNKDHFNHDVDPVLRAAQADGQNKTLTSGVLAATPNVLKYYEVRPLH